MEIDRHFIKEKFEAGIICTPFVPTTQQLADILTNRLQRPVFEHLTNKLDMIVLRFEGYDNRSIDFCIYVV